MCKFCTHKTNKCSVQCSVQQKIYYIIKQKRDRIACENRIDFSELIHQSKQIFACNYRLYDNDEMTYYNEELKKK